MSKTFKVSSLGLENPRFRFVESQITEAKAVLKGLPSSVRYLLFSVLEKTLSESYTDGSAKAMANAILFGLLYGMKLEASTEFNDEDLKRLTSVNDDLYKDLICLVLSLRNRVRLVEELDDWKMVSSEFHEGKGKK